MQRDLIRKTGSLAGTSEFTVLAPIKAGLVPALEAVSYKSRVKRVLRTLHLGRTGAHEHELARVLSDAVERVGRIHSVSIRVLEPEDKVMLAVTFDGAWEAYVRVIWQKVTRLLDLIFHNTEGYPLGWESSYEVWSDWLRRHLSETTFLYATPGLTVADTRYLRMQERLHRRGDDAATQLAVTRLVIPSAESLARAALPLHGSNGQTDLGNPLHGKPVMMARPAYRHAGRSLAGLHRLVEWHRPGTADGEVLRRAAHELLPEFVEMDTASFGIGRKRLLARFPEALAWFEQAPDANSMPPAARRPPELPAAPVVDQPETVQGGIVAPYPDSDQGCLLLVGCTSAAGLAGLLQAALPRITPHTRTPQQGDITCNLGITPAGLRLAGLPEDELLELPDEYIHGMESRAGWLGDLRANHPRRWRLPMRNWADGVGATEPAETDPGPRINLQAVHVVLQLRHCRLAPLDGQTPPAVPALRQALLDELQALLAGVPGAHALSLQWMGLATNAPPGQPQTEHFGFSDGRSNPVLSKAEAGLRYSNQVHLGEVLCGYPNAADSAPAPPASAAGRNAQALLHNGSFWVVRKLRQDVAALEALAAQATAAAGLDRESLLAKMMGRWPMLDVQGRPFDATKAGLPLAPVLNPAKANDFNFSLDAEGGRCPLHAHMRLANPRDIRREKFARPARITRRGMPYGPAADRSIADAEARARNLAQERGLVFMAYNASIGEQFEVVQRWLTGGNSTDGYSGRNDPFVGLPEPGHRRFFMCEDAGRTVRVPLDGDDALQAEPAPLVRLEWGLYLLTPSLTALQRLQTLAATQGPQVVPVWQADEGERQIQRLQAVLQQSGCTAAALAWKLSLEDPESAADFQATAIWEAIRVHHGGVLRTPYGVLVADKQTVHQVLLDQTGQLSATGYLPRMRRTFGEMYLGMDAGQTDGAYERESAICNQAIMALDVADIFRAARTATHAALNDLAGTAHDEAVEDGEQQWHLTLDLRELVNPVLAHFCESWFGLSTTGGHFQRGGMRWNWQPGQAPWYPGHFLAPSRYVFQPHPGRTVEDLGADHGQAVNKAMKAYLLAYADDILYAGTAKVACKVLNAGLDPAGTRAFSARTLAGAIMGFVPTVDGNLRRIAHEWLREGTLWRLRSQFAGQPSPDLATARQWLGRDFGAAMQLRAVPEVLWRTAIVSHQLGADPAHAVAVEPGDLLVVGLAASTQQRLADGPAMPAGTGAEPGPDLAAIFGGDRWAVPRPTHACPGSHAAMAVMLGFFSALVESTLALRPGPGPLSLAADGKAVPPAAPAAAGAAAVSPGAGLPLKASLLSSTGAVFGPVGTTAGGAAPASTTAPALRGLKAIGDSWLAPPPIAGAGMPTLGAALRPLGYDLQPAGDKDPWPLAMAGQRMVELAGRLDDIRDYLVNLDPSGDGLPRAILLAAGGNDLVHQSQSDPTMSPLWGMLKAGAGSAAASIDDAALGRFLDGLLVHYRSIIDTVIDTSQQAGLPAIPILVHGYDHPIPDAQGYSVYTIPNTQPPQTVLVGPWLIQVFVAAGIHDAALQRAVMVLLIDALNGMLAGLAQHYPGRVHAIKLTGTLAGASPADPGALWENELHPTQAGFAHMAALFAARLDSL